MTETFARIEQYVADAGAAIAGELATVADPVERQDIARATAEVLLPRLTRDVKSQRAAAIAEIRDERHLSLAKVGQIVGGISGARVDQILKEGHRGPARSSRQTEAGAVGEP